METSTRAAGDGPDRPEDERPGRRAGEIVGGRYRLGPLIASGGMGDVYEAEHLGLGRTVALKFIRPERQRDPVILERFAREARTLAALAGDHVVSVLDVDSAGGAPFLVMERLHGEDLAAVLARGPLEVATAVTFVIEACEGLARAHERGLVHRDIKPGNLFLCRDDRGASKVKLLDFGIVKLPPAAGAALTATGQPLGTAPYMAPEQARGEQGLDARVDVHALGAILYEALTGRRAHPGETYNEVLYHVLTQPVEPPSVARPGLPPGLEAVVLRALAPRAVDRQRDAAELRDELVPYASSVATTTCAGGATAAAAARGRGVVSRRLLPPRHRGAAPRLLAVGVAAAAIGLFVQQRGRGEGGASEAAAPVAVCPAPPAAEAPGLGARPAPSPEPPPAAAAPAAAMSPRAAPAVAPTGHRGDDGERPRRAERRPAARRPAARAPLSGARAAALAPSSTAPAAAAPRPAASPEADAGARLPAARFERKNPYE
jgi:serine/threonine-protein kinase